jgi:Flp pilus assembly protein TadD
MPINTLTSLQAQGNLRRNRLSIWPDGRKGKGRLGEYTTCEASPSFNFSRDDLIFTTGSCFARNIERKLGELGFNLPMLRIDMPEEERISGARNEIVNKYTTAAVLNELRWGLGLEEFPEHGLLELEGGLVHDPHLHPQVPPVTRERAVERRGQIHEAVGTLPQCRIFIMTLGLVEAWYDQETGLYLNGSPPNAAMAAQPDRFSFRRQSHAEILADLETIYSIVRQHGHPEFKMILSVSPVPFKATYTGQDAIAANTYSKSVLRAAAEEFVQGHDNVDYFPSYEMVTLSDRKAAYWDDNIHVQEVMVSRIMDLAVSRYVPGYVGQNAEDDLSRYGEKPRELLAAAVNLRGQADYVTAAKLMQAIEETNGVVYTDMPAPEFYLLYGTTLARAGRNAEAEPHLARAVALAPNDPLATFKLGIISARLRRPHALDLLERAVQMNPSSAEYAWRLGVQYERVKRPDDALAAFRKALSLDPSYEEAHNGVQRLTAASGAKGEAVAA